MGLDQLRKKFIVDEDVLKARLEPIVSKISKHCVVGKNGQVHLSSKGLTGRTQVMLVLAARAVASQLEPDISAEVAVADVESSTGLPKNQIRARGMELINAKLAVSPTRGVYKAVFHKVEGFLDGLSGDNGRPEGGRNPS